MEQVTRLQIWWGAANAIGIGAFLILASAAWIEPELADLPGASAGNFIIWGITALPVLILFALLHLAVGGFALIRARHGWSLAVLTTAACWVVAFLFDNVHHGV